MGSKKIASPLEGFTRLGGQVFVRPVEISATMASATRPTDATTIIIYGWGDANPRHLLKYVDGYRRLFPAAKIIIVLGFIAKLFYQGLKRRSLDMQAVVKAVFEPTPRDTTTESADDRGLDERLLLHAMSNTGGTNYAATLHAYNQLYPGLQLPHVLAVFDSTPGGSSFFANIGPWSRAMAIGAARWFPGPRVLFQGVAVVFLSITTGLAWLLGQESAAVFSWKAVNDPGYEAVASGRVYLYSKADEIVGWDAVEAHAREAEAKGYRVALEMFPDTGHVDHMRVHPERYWKVIEHAWELATQGKRVQSV